MTHLALLRVLTLIILTQSCVLAQGQVELRMAAEIDKLKGEDAQAFLKPLVNLELSFIERVCQPDFRQMDAIVTEARKAYAAMSDMLVDQAVVWNGLDPVSFVGPNQQRLKGNPYHRVREDAAKYLAPLLTPEQYQRYTDESKQRDEFERKAAIGIVITLIDQRLALTSQQRTQLMDALMKGWEDIDFQFMQNYQSNPQFMPRLPSGVIKPLLNPTQAKLWNVAQSSTAMISVSVNPPRAPVLMEEWIE